MRALRRHIVVKRHRGIFSRCTENINQTKYTTLLIIHRRILHQRPQLSPYHSKLNVSNMPKRYFSNPYTATDHTRKDVTFWKSKISQIVQEILKHQKLDRRDLGRLTYLKNLKITSLFKYFHIYNQNIFCEEGGLYVGAAGVSYMLWYLHHRLPGETDQTAGTSLYCHVPEIFSCTRNIFSILSC